MARRFPVLVEDPGETHAFRRRFHQAVSLGLLYRLVGTVAATAGFAWDADVLAHDPDPVYLLAAAYCIYSAWLLYRIGWPEMPFRWRWLRWLRMGPGSYDLLDRPAFIYGDFAAAVGLNLAMLVFLAPGRAYHPYSDVFSVALITSVTILTGRRGPRLGLRALGLGAAVVAIQGVVNHVPLTVGNVMVFGFRTFWMFCGFVVAYGLVRILLDYADRSERLRISDEMLAKLSLSHNDYKEALRAILEVLASADKDNRKIAIHMAEEALAVGERRGHQGDHHVDAVVAEAIDKARATANPAFEFVPVEGTKRPIRLCEPGMFKDIVVHLCANAARWSKGTRATIRWALDDGHLVVTVRDNGDGMEPGASGPGLALSDRLAQRMGGQLHTEPVSAGAMWVLRLPTTAYEAE